MADINELRRQRNRVLVSVYELTDGGNGLKSVTDPAVVAATTYDETTVERAVQWLVDHDLLERRTFAGNYRTTPSGNDEAERLLSEQTDPLAVTLTPIELRVLEAFTREVRLALDEAALAPEALTDAEAQLATVEAQQRSPRPRRVVIAYALRALEGAAESVVGGVLGNTAYDVIRSMLA